MKDRSKQAALHAVVDHRNVNDEMATTKAQKSVIQLDFLLDIFTSLDPAVVGSVYDNAIDADAALSILQEMAGTSSTNEVQQVRLLAGKRTCFQ